MSTLVLLLCLTGCSVPTGKIQEPRTPYSATNGIVSIYFDYDNTSQPYDLNFDQIELFTQGVWYLLEARNTSQQGLNNRRQRLLALDSLPANTFTHIRFKIEIEDREGNLVRSQHSELPLTEFLEIKKGDSRCLFIRQQVTADQTTSPLSQWLTVSPQRAPLTDELLYILCPEIHTLYLARIDQYRIIAAYPLEGNVIDMSLDDDKRLLYLLDNKNLLIQRFDTATQRMTDRIPLPLTESPQGLELSGDGSTLYVTDPFNRQVLSINAYDGILQNSTTIGYDPTFPHWYQHNNNEYLALISKTDQQLMVVNGSTLNLLFSTSAGQTPHDVIYADDSLFVTDPFNRQLLKFSPETGQQLAQISTNGSPQFFEVDPINQNILITLNDQKSVTFLPFGQQMTVRKAYCDNDPTDLVISNNRRLLFVANHSIKKITVLDLLSQQHISTIDVGSAPTIIVVQEP